MTVGKIRMELAILRKKLIAEGVNENLALNLARKAMNDKYGKSWRNEGSKNKQNKIQIYPSFYEGHTNGEHWMD